MRNFNYHYKYSLYSTELNRASVDGLNTRNLSLTLSNFYLFIDQARHDPAVTKYNIDHMINGQTINVDHIICGQTIQIGHRIYGQTINIGHLIYGQTIDVGHIIYRQTININWPNMIKQ